jgi:hypothetical protein
VLALFCVGTNSANAAVGYISGQFGEPWGVNNNIVAMDAAFGSGNWNHLNFANAIGNGALTPAYDYLYLDGGDGTDTQFVNFVTANQTALEDWVADGGCLFLNAGTWGYPNPVSLGFGVTLNEAFDGGRNTASAVNAAHPIFNGPYTPTGLAWTGTYFSHNDVTGAGLTPLIIDGFGRTILAEKDWGLGHAMFGGLTTDNFHSPSLEAANLKANILAYGADCAIPEPATGVLLALGIVAAVGLCRRNGR